MPACGYTNTMRTSSNLKVALCVGFFLVACSTLVDARSSKIPPPTPVPPLRLRSEQIQKELLADMSVARGKALQSNPMVTRKFVVGWELHHGYFFIPVGSPNAIVTPDLLDKRVLADFNEQNRQDVLAKHVGQKLICECKGISWAFHSNQRFVVQAARLTWTD